MKIRIKKPKGPRYTMKAALAAGETRLSPIVDRLPADSPLALAYRRQPYDIRKTVDISAGSVPPTKVAAEKSLGPMHKREAPAPKKLARELSVPISELHELGTNTHRDDLGDTKYGLSGRLSAWMTRRDAGTPDLKNAWLLREIVGQKQKGWRA